jgi:hypothetical protein
MIGTPEPTVVFLMYPVSAAGPTGVSTAKSPADAEACNTFAELAQNGVWISNCPALARIFHTLIREQDKNPAQRAYSKRVTLMDSLRLMETVCFIASVGFRERG